MAARRPGPAVSAMEYSIIRSIITVSQDHVCTQPSVVTSHHLLMLFLLILILHSQQKLVLVLYVVFFNFVRYLLFTVFGESSTL